MKNTGSLVTAKSQSPASGGATQALTSYNASNTGSKKIDNKQTNIINVTSLSETELLDKI